MDVPPGSGESRNALIFWKKTHAIKKRLVHVEVDGWVGGWQTENNR